MNPSITLLLILLTTSVIGHSDVDLIDDPIKTHSQDEIKSDHVTPDINCLINSHGNYFMETIPQFNAKVEPEPFFAPIDAFIIHLNSQIENKAIGFDNFIETKDINEYFELADPDKLEFRVFFDKCAKVPQRFGLNIIELNYLYCVLVWKNGFEIYEEKFLKNPEFEKGFFRVIENTVGEVFNYKTYIQNIKLSKFMSVFWMAFYSNFNEFLSLNKQYEELKDQTIVEIKKNNFFFNKETSREKNLFMNFYLNLVSVIHSLNKAYFHFSVKGDKVMTLVQKWSDEFESLIVEDMYESLFYLLMRSDETFVHSLNKYAVRYHCLVPQMSGKLNELKMKLTEHLQEEIRKDNLFDPSIFGPENEESEGHFERRASIISSDEPLLNQDLDHYKDRLNTNAEVDKLQEEIDNQPEIQAPKNALDYIEEANANARRIHGQRETARMQAAKVKLSGTHDVRIGERVLAEKQIKSTKKSWEREIKTKEKHGKVANHRELITGGPVEKPASSSTMLFNRVPGKDSLVRDLLQVPAQPELADPQQFFERMDQLKKPMSSIVVNKMQLSEFFKLYEDKVKDYYGLSSNLELIRICKSHFKSKIIHFSNIFCLILQREASLLIQQKYGNTRVRAFIDKYLPFITYNFFTYFMILEERNVKVDILALNLFYCEKFFSAIKLSIVSLNNLVMHFEEDYRDFYREEIREVMMPLFNQFKETLIHVLYGEEFREEATIKRVQSFALEKDELKTMFLPLFREEFEEVILHKVVDDMNVEILKEQYGIYVNSMNLLTYDKIREKFVSYSQKFGIRTSSEGPSDECSALHIKDVVKDYKNDVRQKMGKEMTEEAEEVCVKKWKMFDDLFHNVFYDTQKKEIIIKKKVESSPSEKVAFEEYMENELIRVVNFFLPERMKHELQHFVGDTKLNLERCGISDTYSRSSCFRIFGNDKCVPIKGTFFYIRKCPEGFYQKGMSCVFDCESEDMMEEGEFCKKHHDRLDVACPHGLTPKETEECLKPPRKYFPVIMSPFNNKE